MISHGKGVDGRPQAPTRPFPQHVWLDFVGHDQRYEVARVSGDDGAAAQVGAVAEECKGEDDDERSGGAHGCKRVGRDGAKA